MAVGPGPFERVSSTGNIEWVQDLNQLAEPARESDVPAWLAVGAPLLLLALAALAARWFLRRGPALAPSRWLRILAAATALSGVATILFVVERIGLGNSAADGAVETIVALAAMLLIGLVIVGVADALLGLFHPERSRRWLAIAAACFALFIATFDVILGLIDGNLATPSVLESLRLVFIASVVGLAWWTCLPAPRKDVARVFD